ncbi:MAG: MFS transporter [Bacteroidetes bacterium GWA2_32_17]|nr:MAG: MFS transporter [Bacteroidetes bacterium GWA2_32_17]
MENNSSHNVNPNLLMAILMVTLFFNAFMGAAVNIAIPIIAKDFSMSAVESSWVAMSFLLSSAMFLLPFGKIGDIYGRKKVFLIGNIIFTLSTLSCAFSSNSLMLISFRFIQGIGGAMIMSTGMAIVTSAFSPKERGKMLGLVVSAVYLGLTAAPVIGGILTQVYSWHSIFIVSVIAGILVITGILVRVKGDWLDAKNEKLDYFGSIIYMFSIFMLMYGFSKLPEYKAIVIASIGLIGIILFVIYEKRILFPVLNIKLFISNKVFAFSNLAALINYAATFAITFLLSLYLQYEKGLQPRDAGLILITQPAIMAITALISGRLSDKFDSRILASIGMAITVVGLVLLFNLDSETTNLFLIISLVIVGIGFGMFSTPNTNSVMSSVEKRQLGIASATISTMRIMGQILSMAIAAMVIHIFLGDAKISKDNVGLFMQSSKVIFLIFAILCFIGIFASLARGQKKLTET